MAGRVSAELTSAVLASPELASAVLASPELALRAHLEATTTVVVADYLAPATEALLYSAAPVIDAVAEHFDEAMYAGAAAHDAVAVLAQEVAFDAAQLDALEEAAGPLDEIDAARRYAAKEPVLRVLAHAHRRSDGERRDAPRPRAADDEADAAMARIARGLSWFFHDPRSLEPMGKEVEGSRVMNTTTGAVVRYFGGRRRL